MKACCYLAYCQYCCAVSCEPKFALDPQYFDAYYQRGKVSAQLGDRSGAIADYHQAANLDLDRGDSSTYQQILQVLHYLSS
jgi:tetratricopeptide (TPR) repeat protein